MRSGDRRLVYTVAEAAELLGIGRSTVCEQGSCGELTMTRLGGRLVVTRPTLASLLGLPTLPGELDDARGAAASSSRHSRKAGSAAPVHGRRSDPSPFTG